MIRSGGTRANPHSITLARKPHAFRPLLGWRFRHSLANVQEQHYESWLFFRPPIFVKVTPAGGGEGQTLDLHAASVVFYEC